MSLREKINEQFNVALKNKDKTLVSTLRLILAAIKETSEGQMDPTQSPVDDTHAQNIDDANQVIKNNAADTCTAITRSIDAEQD